MQTRPLFKGRGFIRDTRLASPYRVLFTVQGFIRGTAFLQSRELVGPCFSSKPGNYGMDLALLQSRAIIVWTLLFFKAGQLSYGPCFSPKLGNYLMDLAFLQSRATI